MKNFLIFILLCFTLGIVKDKKVKTETKIIETSVYKTFSHGYTTMYGSDLCEDAMQDKSLKNPVGYTIFAIVSTKPNKYGLLIKNVGKLKTSKIEKDVDETACKSGTHGYSTLGNNRKHATRITKAVYDKNTFTCKKDIEIICTTYLYNLKTERESIAITKSYVKNNRNIQRELEDYKRLAGIDSELSSATELEKDLHISTKDLLQNKY